MQSVTSYIIAIIFTIFADMNWFMHYFCLTFFNTVSCPFLHCLYLTADLIMTMSHDSEISDQSRQCFIKVPLCIISNGLGFSRLCGSCCFFFLHNSFSLLSNSLLQRQKGWLSHRASFKIPAIFCLTSPDTQKNYHKIKDTYCIRCNLLHCCNGFLHCLSK